MLGINYAKALEVKKEVVKVDGYEVPEGLYYSKEWFWVKIEDGKARLGLTDYAQKQLREIVFVELPSAGGTVKVNEPFGSVESVKAVSDLVAPLSGTIEQANQEVKSKPELLNEDPFDKGWLLIIAPTNLNAELAALMNFDKSVEWHKSMIAKG
jgi:glycine cleavage system H protein